MSSRLSFTVPCPSGSQPKTDAAASMTSRSPVDQWDCERRSGNRIPPLGVMYELTQLSGRSANAEAWTSKKSAARCCGPRAAAIARGDTGEVRTKGILSTANPPTGDTVSEVIRIA
jgi:hypothetical protein